MSDFYSSICISSVKATVLELFGIDKKDADALSNPLVTALAEKKLGGKKIDRAVIYNPDAVALWLYKKYTDMFTKAAVSSDIAMPMLSVMPSVTPVALLQCIQALCPMFTE